MASEIIFTIYQSPWFWSLQGNFKNIGIGSAEFSWGDVKKIKSVKVSALGSKISENKSRVYTSACIEEARIGKILSNMDSNDSSHSHSWNDEDNAFAYQLYKWGIYNLFQTSDEVIIIELKIYVKHW